MTTPRRTCVGCRGVDERGALVRLVAGGEGVTVDRRGSAPGRGAYVHPDPDCVAGALARDGSAVFRALRRRAEPGAAARLRRDIEGELQA